MQHVNLHNINYGLIRLTQFYVINFMQKGIFFFFLVETCINKHVKLAFVYSGLIIVGESRFVCPYNRNLTHIVNIARDFSLFDCKKYCSPRRSLKTIKPSICIVEKTKFSVLKPRPRKYLLFFRIRCMYQGN